MLNTTKQKLTPEFLKEIVGKMKLDVARRRSQAQVEAGAAAWVRKELAKVGVDLHDNYTAEDLIELAGLPADFRIKLNTREGVDELTAKAKAWAIRTRVVHPQATPDTSGWLTVTAAAEQAGCHRGRITQNCTPDGPLTYHGSGPQRRIEPKSLKRWADGLKAKREVRSANGAGIEKRKKIEQAKKRGCLGMPVDE